MSTKVKYEFQGLLHKDKEGKITGPMSPVTMAATFAKEIGFKISGLVRVTNNQSYNATYDHLMCVTNYTNDQCYRLFVDMGIGVLPVAMYWKSDDSVTHTPIYGKECYEERRQYHLSNMEQSKRSTDNPIMILNDDELKELFHQAMESDEFKIK